MLKRIDGRLKHIRWLFSFFKGNCKVLPFLAIIEGFVPIGTVVCSKVLLQELINNRGIRVLLWWVFSIVGLQLLGKIILHYRMVWIKPQLSKIKSECMKNIALTYGAADLSSAESEDMMKGKENAINAIDFNDSIKNLMDSICIFISGIVMLLGGIGLIADLSAILIVVVVVSFIPQYMVNKTKKNFDFKNMKKWVDLNRKTNCYSSLLEEIRTIKELQLYNAEGLILDTIGEVDCKRTCEMIKQERYHTVLDLCFHFVRTLSDAIIYGYLVVKLLSGIIQIPDFTLYIGGIHNLSKSIENISISYIGLKQYMKYLDGYDDFVKDKKSYSFNDEVKESLPTIETIEFSGVFFKYPGQEQYTLENVSVILHKNEHISLVGRNGAGKTTFVKLLLGLYRPLKGEIKINGMNIDKFSREELNQIYSVLFQDYHIFPVSVYENVTLQEKSKSGKNLKQLYSRVGMQDRLKKLTLYDDTVIEPVFEDGVDFSGGEKLRLAIARAMYKDAPVIVLDEPSSALDPKAEFEFYQMVSALNYKKTVIFVSHRMSSSKFSDRILVFDRAQLVGDGSHEELIKRNGKYAHLYRIQAEQYK